MAYVINPDGTVDLIEVEYDSYGNMRPKRSYESSKPSFQSSAIKSSSTSSRKRKKIKKATSFPPQGNSTKVVESTPPLKEQHATTKKTARIITKQSIEKFFIRKKNLRQRVTHEDLMRASIVLKSSLLKYFMQKYDEYKEYCLNMGWGPKIVKTKKKKVKKSKKQKHSVVDVSRKDTHNPTGKTIADIATFSALKDSLADSEVVYNRRSSRTPVYSYARDRFGRVQERDSFNEEKRNEFKQAQKHQRNYDYSSYDAEDDHDSYYDSGSFD